MTYILEQAKTIFDIEDCTFTPVIGHEGGRNLIVIVSRNGDNKYVLRISDIGDRTEKDYLAETELVQYLAENGAPVADVIPSVNGKLVEKVEADDKAIYVSLFAYAKGMLLADNGYRYREGASLDEYFYNTGKALGLIHRLSKEYEPAHSRQDYFDKYIYLLEKTNGGSSYQYKYYMDLLGNLCMKNTETKLMADGRRSRKHPRRGAMGSKLLETLVQILVLEKEEDGKYHSRSFSIDELAQIIRDRYGLIINGANEPRFSNADVETLAAFQDNMTAFKNKLRQIGFYTDLSDACLLQKIRPRYSI